MGDIGDTETKVATQERSRIRKRILDAEKEKLDLKYPRGINQDIEKIIREEIN